MATTATTITSRDLLVAVIDGTELTPELIAKARAMLSALDAKNEKRKSADSKEKRETSDRRVAVLNLLVTNTDKQFTRDDIATELSITPTQASSACSTLIKDGKVAKSEAKIDKVRRVVYSAIVE